VQGSGCRVQGSGSKVQGSGFRVQGAGFKVEGRYPRAAATMASAMPVLPEVGSTRVVLPAVMSPRFSASSIIANLPKFTICDFRFPEKNIGFPPSPSVSPSLSQNPVLEPFPTGI